MTTHTTNITPAIASPRSTADRPRSTMAFLRRETVVGRGLDETFAFFSDARNLQVLTPPWVGFEILTPTPIEMQRGTLIDYRIRIHGFPLTWRTEIVVWEPPHCFVDLQIRGPYRWWHHTHRFEAYEGPGGGTRVIDEVEYRAPLAWLSHRLMVARDVARIFDYRAGALERLLGPASPPRPSA